jgi:hypothetical protein
MGATQTQVVENLKLDGYYFAAGAVAAAYKLGPYYGCHFGMKSTYQSSKDEFYRGYRAGGGG